jgi:hypothetical protein
MHQDRREVERVRLQEPVRGRVGATSVFVLDISVQGFRVAHQSRLGAIGTHYPVVFNWRGEEVSVECELVRTELQRVGSASYSKTLYHSALSITEAHRSMSLIRDIVEWHVTQALDEQLANARGIPPNAAQSFQTGKGTDYLRHELVSGKWVTTPTTDPSQPYGGFTILADHSEAEVVMLRQAYEKGDASARIMIRRMAELSISQSEGVPTRRYTP